MRDIGAASDLEKTLKSIDSAVVTKKVQENSALNEQRESHDAILSSQNAYNGSLYDKEAARRDGHESGMIGDNMAPEPGFSVDKSWNKESMLAASNNTQTSD